MSEIQKSQSFDIFERVEQARFEKTRSLFGYWKGLQQGGQPTRCSLDPVEMKQYLPNLLTGNIERDPFRVLYKLVGTTIVEYSQSDFSNRYLDELDYSGRDTVDWQECYRNLSARQCPLIGACSLKGAAARIIASYEFAILPLWRGCRSCRQLRGDRGL